MTREQAIKRLDKGDKSFDVWFTAQFGPKPIYFYNKHMDAQKDVVFWEAHWRAATEWDFAYNAALKAWAIASSK